MNKKAIGGKKVIYLGSFRFPDLDAAAKRVYMVGLILRELNYEVVFAGGETKINQSVFNEYDGFKYFSEEEIDSVKKSFFLKLICFFTRGAKTFKWLKNYNKINNVDLILLYNSSFFYQRKIINFCKKNKIKIIGDCTEWYESSHLPGGKYGLVSFTNYLKMHCSFPRMDAIIVISHFLRKVYIDKNKDTLVLPPLINEICLNNTRKKENDFIELLYAGSPGKKDKLIDVIEELNQDRNHRIRLTIVGLTKEKFVETLKVNQLNIENKNVIFLGRISFDEISEYYKKSDFSILIRENKRYANAGFSTKFVESLSYGVPVIANITSDLDLYLKDKINGIVLKSDQKKDISIALKTIRSLKNSEIELMKKNAIKTASVFLKDNYKEELDRFIK